MLLTHCQDHILTENIWFVWSRTSYRGDKGRCHRCGTDGRTNEQGKIELLSQWMLDKTQSSHSLLFKMSKCQQKISNLLKEIYWDFLSQKILSRPSPISAKYLISGKYHFEQEHVWVYRNAAWTNFLHMRSVLQPGKSSERKCVAHFCPRRLLESRGFTKGNWMHLLTFQT